MISQQNTLKPPLQGSCFVLRAWTMDDVPALVRHGDNREVWRNMGDVFPHPYTEERAREWVQMNLDGTCPFTNFAIAVDGEACGSVGFQRHADVWRTTARIGYWLGEAYWGRGIVTEALELMTRYAFDTEDITRVEASVFAWNPASCRVLEKAGYTFEARLRQAIRKDGEITDALMYSIMRDDLA